MALQGTLDTLRLADVLRLLAATAKTGCLRVQGDRGEGSVWVRDGLVTAAGTDRVFHAPLDQVLCDLLRYEIGSYCFDNDDRSPIAEDPSAVEDLLDSARSLLAEWAKLQAVVPSLEHRVNLVHALPFREVTITDDQWQAVAAVGSGCSVGELRASMSLTEFDVLRTVHDLVMPGLVSLEAPLSASREPSQRDHRPTPLTSQGARTGSA